MSRLKRGNSNSSNAGKNQVEQTQTRFQAKIFSISPRADEVGVDFPSPLYPLCKTAYQPWPSRDRVTIPPQNLAPNEIYNRFGWNKMVPSGELTWTQHQPTLPTKVGSERQREIGRFDFDGCNHLAFGTVLSSHQTGSNNSLCIAHQKRGPFFPRQHFQFYFAFGPGLGSCLATSSCLSFFEERKKKFLKTVRSEEAINQTRTFLKDGKMQFFFLTTKWVWKGQFESFQVLSNHAMLLLLHVNNIKLKPKLKRIENTDRWEREKVLRPWINNKLLWPRNCHLCLRSSSLGLCG